MNLRIARKMDQKPGRVDKREWWAVYTCDQLARAQRRLHRSWIRMAPVKLDELGRAWRTVTPDFFRSNRVSSRRIRRATLRRHWPAKYR